MKWEEIDTWLMQLRPKSCINPTAVIHEHPIKEKTLKVAEGPLTYLATEHQRLLLLQKNVVIVIATFCEKEFTLSMTIL